MTAWLLAGATALFSAFLCHRFLDPGSRFHVLDLPGHRSLHERPTPRTGGVAILAALLAGWWLGVAGNLVPLSPVPIWMSAGILVLGVLGAWDDRHDLPARVRFPVQALVALAVVPADLVPATLMLPGGSLALSWPVALMLALLFVLWMTNLYNFMDGMDGLAGLMALSGFGLLAWLGHLGGDDGYALLALLVAAASAGFLWLNFPPARLFMGDAGAPALGFLAACFLLWGDRKGLFPLWQGLLAFLPFVVDATWTLLRRALRGEVVWEAHCSHLYQKLVRRGWSHRRTLAWSGLLMLASALAAAGAGQLTVTGQKLLLLAVGLGWAGIILVVERHAGAPE